MTDYQAITLQYLQQLQKAVGHFIYSFQKIQKLPIDVAKMDDEILETWESFSARFSRVVDLFLTKYVRAAVKLNDPGFEGSLRDYINQAEKLGILTDASRWMALRELRNISALTYENMLSEFLQKLRDHSGPLLKLQNLSHAP